MNIKVYQAETLVITIEGLHDQRETKSSTRPVKPRIQSGLVCLQSETTSPLLAILDLSQITDTDRGLLYLGLQPNSAAKS